MKNMGAGQANCSIGIAVFVYFFVHIALTNPANAGFLAFLGFE
jgi:hypothetical protein